MTIKGCSLLVAFVLFCMFDSTYAGEQIGLFGVQGATNHEAIPRPLGVGVFLQKDISRLTTFRVSYSWAKDSDAFIKTIYKHGGLVQEGDTIRDFWEQDASMRVFELSLFLNVIQNDELSFSVGPSLGMAKYHQKAVGRSTGFEWGGDSRLRQSLSLIADFGIFPRPLRPIGLRLFVRERVTASGGHNCADCSEPFSDTITSFDVALAIAYTLH